MATYQGTMPAINAPASADLSTKQYLAVTLNSSGQIIVVTDTGLSGIGVLQDKPDAAGRPGEVAIVGSGVSTKWVASAAIAAGAKVTAAATAKAGKAVTAGSGDHVFGIAMEAAAAEDDVIEVLLISLHILA